MNYDFGKEKLDTNSYWLPRKKNVPRQWSQLSYAGEQRVPPSEDPTAGTWPTYFLRRDEQGRFIDNKGEVISFKIRQPDVSIDFEGKQLDIVKETLNNITEQEIEIAKYWGEGPANEMHPKS